MSGALILLTVAVVAAVAALILHVVVVVHAFKTSVGRGLLSLFVPLASIVHGLTRMEGRGGRAVAWSLLAATVAAAALWIAASAQAAQVFFAPPQAPDEKGVQEFEQQMDALDGLDNLELDLSK